MSTTEIVNEFVTKVDTDKEYTLNELKKILTEVYTNMNVKSTEKKTIKKSKAKEKEEKPAKRAPTAYNNFIKQRITEMKAEHTGTPAKELLGMAAAEWKNLSAEEKEAYK